LWGLLLYKQNCPVNGSEVNERFFRTGKIFEQHCQFFDINPTHTFFLRDRIKIALLFFNLVQGFISFCKINYVKVFIAAEFAVLFDNLPIHYNKRT
jgi:hypothetical protein